MYVRVYVGRLSVSFRGRDARITGSLANAFCERCWFLPFFVFALWEAPRALRCWVQLCELGKKGGSWRLVRLLGWFLDDGTVEEFLYGGNGSCCKCVIIENVENFMFVIESSRAPVLYRIFCFGFYRTLEVLMF